MEKAWKPEQPFGPPSIEWNADPEPVAKETTTVLLPPETQLLDANDSVELENNNSNYLKRLTSDDPDDVLPQEKRQRVDNEDSADFDEKYPYHCGACGKAFARPTWWAKHESGCFKSKNKENQAQQANSPVIEQPRSAEKKQRKEPYACTLCGKAFACPSWLVRHMRTHKNSSQTDQGKSSADDEPLPYVCADCGRGFSYPSRLERHRKSNHPSAKPHSSGAKPHSSGAKLHSSGSRGYACRDCGRTFAVQSWLTRHRSKAHNNAFVAKKHLCGVCGRSFVLSIWLERHMKVHQDTKEQQSAKEPTEPRADFVDEVHKETQGSEIPAKILPEMPWVCGDCGLRFKFISWLTRHQKNTKHSNGYFDKQNKETVYKWICDHPGCDKAYKMKHHLARHKLTHLRDSGMKERVETENGGKFICQEKNCGREFETKRMFTRHKFKHLYSKNTISDETSVGSHVCKQCNKVFDTNKILERHSKRVHGVLAADGTPQKPGPPYPCRYCGEEYQEPLPLGRHVASCKKREERAQAAASLSFETTTQKDTKHPKSEAKTEAKGKSSKQVDDSVHECDICGRRFAVAFWLTRHKAEHEFDHPHQCDECGRTFAVSSWLTRHKREHTVAKEATNDKDDQSDELPEPITKGNSKIYKCDICGMEFTWPSWLMKHRKLHKVKLTDVKEKSTKKTKATVNNDGTKPAPTSKKEVVSYEGKDANDMFILVDKNGIKTYECKVCKKSTVWHTGIIYHIRVHHTKERPFKCKLCTKAFHMAGDLTKHVRRHAGEKPFQCRQCNKCFATSQQLRNHNIVHGGKKSESFHCTGCGKVYTDRSSVWRHIRRTACPGKCAKTLPSGTESAEKVNKITLQENASKTAQEKKTHKLGNATKAEKTSKQGHSSKHAKLDRTDNSSKEEEEKKKKKKTSKPEKSAMQDNQVEQEAKAAKQVKRKQQESHQDYHETKEETTVKENKKDKKVTKKNFVCKNCDKTLPNSEAFKAHIEYHRKRKQIVCEYCGKCWVRIADLKRHIRVHTNERPYQCPECILAFKVSDALRRHMRQLHPRSTKQIIRLKTESEASSHSKDDESDHTKPPPSKRAKTEPARHPRSARAKSLRRGRSDLEEEVLASDEEKLVIPAKSENEDNVKHARKEPERQSKRLRSNSLTSADSKGDEKEAKEQLKTKSKKVVTLKHGDGESEKFSQLLDSEAKKPRKSVEHTSADKDKSGEHCETNSAETKKPVKCLEEDQEIRVEKSETEPQNDEISDKQPSQIPEQPVQQSDTDLDKPVKPAEEESSKMKNDQPEPVKRETELDKLVNPAEGEFTKTKEQTSGDCQQIANDIVPKPEASTHDQPENLQSIQSNPTDPQTNNAQKLTNTSETQSKAIEQTQSNNSNKQPSDNTVEQDESKSDLPDALSDKDMNETPHEAQPVLPRKKIRGRKSKKKTGKHKCEYCGKFFAGPANLTRHVRLHTGEKPFKCKHCEVCFMRTDVLYQHIAKHHNNEH